MSKQLTKSLSPPPASKEGVAAIGDNASPNDATAFYEKGVVSPKHLSSVQVSPNLRSLHCDRNFPSGIDPPDNGEFKAAPATTIDGASSNPRYLIGKELGRGGMGAVFEGWDVQLQRRVAIKIIREEECTKPNSLLRFFREARIASRLRHPGIISIHEFDITEDGQAFIVMGMLYGPTLNELLDSIQDRVTELPSLISTFFQVCQAIAYAHSQGVIHRDLKPANIIVGRFGVVTVLDWGLAKVIGEQEPPPDIAGTDSLHDSAASHTKADGTVAEPYFLRTEVGTIFGTPSYLAPEQAAGDIDRIDKRSDVFGLGSILCEILTGRPPFLGKSLLEIHSKAMSGDTQEAIAMLDSCMGPRPMVILAKQCLSPNPADRPQDASYLVNAITEYLESGQRRAEQALFASLISPSICFALPTSTATFAASIRISLAYWATPLRHSLPANSSSSFIPTITPARSTRSKSYLGASQQFSSSTATAMQTATISGSNGPPVPRLRNKPSMP